MPKYILVPIGRDRVVDLHEEDRVRVSDEKLSRFIQSHPNMAWSPLLRAARAAGMPCGQGRFRALHQRIRRKAA